MPTEDLGGLAALHGGTVFVQCGHSPSQPQTPPRQYWLVFEHVPGRDVNCLRSGARIANSWAMSLRLLEHPAYRRTLDCLSITYILRGRGVFLDPAGAHDVRAGSAMLLFPDVPHAYGPTRGERWDEISVFFDGPIFRAWQRPGLLDPAVPVCHLEPVDYWLGRFHQVLFPLARSKGEQTPEDWGRMIGLIAEMTSSWQHKASDPEAVWFARATKCLSALPAGDRADWGRVARELGVSERTFRRRFKAATDMTPSQYRTKLRIARAQRCLIESDEKVVETALALGFANEFHFSRRFKQITGMSPRAYREMHRSR